MPVERGPEGLAGLVRDGAIGLDEAVESYLAHGLFPPVPAVGVEVALWALEAIDAGDECRSRVIDDSLTAVLAGWSVVTASEVEEFWHLECFRGLFKQFKRKGAG